MNREKTRGTDVIVIGAGAAGMMAAIVAARRGLTVTVLEHMEKPGRKILATGNGKCNYTNAEIAPSYYYGDRALAASVLKQFTRDETLVFFYEIGVYPKNKNGYYYPNSEQARTVADALIQELERLGAELVTGCKLTAVIPVDAGYVCRTKDGDMPTRNVIFATGLLASPQLGSDGSVIPLIKELGHRFRPILPALTGFYCSGMRFAQVAGVRCEAELTLFTAGIETLKERGELQLTAYGLSGIPMFQLASEAARALYEKKPVSVMVDFLPGLDRQDLLGELGRRQDRLKEEPAGRLLLGLLNEKLAIERLKAAGISPSQPVSSLEEARLYVLAEALAACPVTLERVREAEYAQVCTGGIRTEELAVDTLESKLCPGIFFAGELLDVDGICGGYNLQWAWSSGYVAGSSVK